MVVVDHRHAIERLTTGTPCGLGEFEDCEVVGRHVEPFESCEAAAYGLVGARSMRRLRDIEAEFVEVLHLLIVVSTLLWRKRDDW
jgi:hypothetical protein